MQKYVKQLLLAVAACSLISNVAFAQSAKGDAEAGKVKFQTCAGCHSVEKYDNAYPTYSVPKLGGQHAAYIVSALNAYQSQTRSHETMRANAANLSKEDISDIAAYLTQKVFKGSTNNVRSQAKVAAGKEKSGTCVACHSVDGNSKAPSFPIIAGQHASYLTEALKQYKNGQRKNAIMKGIVADLSEQDMKVLGEYFAAQKGLEPVKE